VGELTTACPIIVIAASFTNMAYERRPLDEDDQLLIQSGGGGGGGGIVVGNNGPFNETGVASGGLLLLLFKNVNFLLYLFFYIFLVSY